MKSRDFCCWLQCMLELTDIKQLDAIHTDKVKRRLELVFKHEIDPSAGDAEEQAALNAIHNKPTFGGQDEHGNLYRC